MCHQHLHDFFMRPVATCGKYSQLNIPFLNNQLTAIQRYIWQRNFPRQLPFCLLSMLAFTIELDCTFTQDSILKSSLMMLAGEQNSHLLSALERPQAWRCCLPTRNLCLEPYALMQCKNTAAFMQPGPGFCMWQAFCNSNTLCYPSCPWWQLATIQPAA